MPNIHYDRLVKKYGEENVRGKKYRKLMEEVIRHNSKSISTGVAKINQDHWKNALRKVTPKGGRFILPDLADVVPLDQFFVNKNMLENNVT